MCVIKSKSTCKLVPSVPGFASAKLHTIFIGKWLIKQNQKGRKPL
jgi:hypothetical protein